MKRIPFQYIKLIGCILSFGFSYHFVSAQNPIPPVGQWREHLNYQHAIQVVKGDKVYCATPSNIISINKDNEVERYSKVTGMNDFGIQCIGWDNLTQQLITAYSNSNVDVFKNGTIRNIGDIKRSSVSGNKTINQIFCKDGIAYLSSGLGIILVNLNKYEIKDTWYIGNNGGQVNVNGFTVDDTQFYAATTEGLKTVSINSNNISNYINWQNLSGANGLNNGTCKNVLFANKSVLVEKNDSILIKKGNSWSLLYTDPLWPIVNTNASEDKILVCQRNTSGSSRVIVLNTNGSIEKTIAQPGIISLPKNAILDNGSVWIADQFGGRLGASTDSVRLGGTHSVHVGTGAQQVGQPIPSWGLAGVAGLHAVLGQCAHRFFRSKLSEANKMDLRNVYGIAESKTSSGILSAKGF
jgi:hypothetical protein